MHFKILVAKNGPAPASRLLAVATGMGHEVIAARNGLEAIEKFQTVEPDLVILDVDLSRLESVEVVRRMRASAGSRWVPIILHTKLDSDPHAVAGLEAGADDCLAEAASPQLIRAKIASFAQILALQQEARGYQEELVSWRADADERNRLGQHVVSRLLEADGLRDPMLKWLNTPAELFSGDLVCAARGPGDVLYVMLADAAGHGLAAALSALPMTQVFYGMAAKGFQIHSIATELNRKLKSFLPIERFVAASLATVDVRNQIIEIWNGGNPDILLLDKDGHISTRWPSRHPPLGILPADQFDATTETVNYSEPGEIALVSDGVVELEAPDGSRLGREGLETMLCAAPPGGRLDALHQGLLAHQAGARQHDDLSCIAVRVPIERRREVRLNRAAAESATEPISEWHMEIAWGATELRDLDVVPAVLGFMSQIQALKPHQGQLFLILSELFNNALDHGVLGLDSRLKSDEGGFERYLAERERCLEALTEGRVSMRFELHQHFGRPVLDIRMEDSGAGFDYAVYSQLYETQSDPTLPHGRGIQLVKRLCETVTYSDQGNQVTVRYPL